MAWVIVPGSNDVWEYDNAGTSSYSDAPGTVAAGIRTFTMPNGNVHKLYVRVRKAGEDLTGLAAEDRGELSKDFYDARVV